MTRLPISLALAAACFVALPAAQAATLSKADYTADKARIGDAYKADKSACNAQGGNAKDVCVEEAKAKEKVARAELEFAHTASARDGNKVLVAKAESTYAVAKERCDDQSGNAKDICVKEAKAVQVKALADAKLGREVRSAARDANEDKREADYKVAAEKCESLSGDARSACMATAKSRFGKT